jgi:hypothetical protein
MTLDTVKIADLVHPPYNPRIAVKRGSALFNQIKHSLQTFGTVQAPVVNRRNMHIVGGNQRTTVLASLGHKTVEVCFVDLDDQKERELNLALNKIGEANWHSNKLAELLASLKDNSDLESLGFGAEEITVLLKAGRAKAKDPDGPAPEPKPDPWVKAGDIFTMQAPGSGTTHRLMCGDSRNPAHLRALTGDAAVNLIFTDPPYGVAYSGTGKNLARNDLQGDLVAGAPLVEMLTAMFRAARSVATATAPIYCFYASRTHREFEDSLNAAGFTVRQQIIWKKQMALGRSDYHWSHEPCFYAAQAEGRGQWRGDRREITTWEEAQPEFQRLTKAELVEWIEHAHKQSTVWEIKRDPTSKYIHPTQKPIALATRAIATTSPWHKPFSTSAEDREAP